MLDSTTCMAKYNEPNLDNGNLIPVYYDEYKDMTTDQISAYCHDLIVKNLCFDIKIKDHLLAVC